MESVKNERDLFFEYCKHEIDYFLELDEKRKCDGFSHKTKEEEYSGILLYGAPASTLESARALMNTFLDFKKSDYRVFLLPSDNAENLRQNGFYYIHLDSSFNSYQSR